LERLEISPQIAKPSFLIKSSLMKTPLEQASSLLSGGIVAFNSLELLPQGFFSLGSSEGVAESFGADAVEGYSIANIKKYEEKFYSVIVTEPSIGEEQSKLLQNIAIRTGKLFFATQFSYAPSVVVPPMTLNLISDS
jgi:hypothetical protein